MNLDILNKKECPFCHVEFLYSTTYNYICNNPHCSAIFVMYNVYNQWKWVRIYLKECRLYFNDKSDKIQCMKNYLEFYIPLFNIFDYSLEQLNEKMKTYSVFT